MSRIPFILVQAAIAFLPGSRFVDSMRALCAPATSKVVVMTTMGPAASALVSSAPSTRPARTKDTKPSGGRHGGEDEVPSLFSASDADAKIIAAVITAVIGLVGMVVVAWIGNRFRKTLEERNLALKEADAGQRRLVEERDLELKKQEQRRLALESQTQERQARQEQERLRVDTMIRATGLLAAEGGREAPPSQVAGALFALAKLGQLDFALTLLQPLWETGRIDPGSAIWLIDLALRSDEHDIQDRAASILSSNAPSLLRDEGGYLWPSLLDGSWSTGLSVYARETVLLALLRVIVSRPRARWATWLASPYIDVHTIMTVDEDPNMKLGAIEAGAILLDVLQEELGDEGRIELGLGGTATVGELRQVLQCQRSAAGKTAEPARPSDAVDGAIRALRQWASA